MSRIFDWLFQRPTRPEIPDRISEQLNKAVETHGEASAQALVALRELLKENERLNKRPQR